MFLSVHRAAGIAALAAAAVSFGPLISLRAQTAADQTVTLDTSRGRASAALRIPPAVSRPAVVVLVAPANAVELSAALASEGVASLRVDDPLTSEDTVAQWIAFLRNDERFPSVTVFSEGAALGAAVIAARAARADGVVVRGDAGDAAGEIARLVAAKTTVGTGSVAGDAGRIAAFARTVPVLGRRGTSAARPAAARRSPRHVILSTIGSVRVGVEWGQPRKRGREIWGGIVPWNEIWMPGADEATTITTNGPLMFGSLEVPAGDHTLYVLPSPDRFQLVISKDVGQFHTVHDASRELGRVDMAAGTRTDALEGLTFTIELAGDSAGDPLRAAGTFRLSWDTREYATRIAGGRRP